MLSLLSNSFSAVTEYYVDFENGVDGARTCTDAGADECKTLQYALDNVTAQAGGSRINVEYDSAAMTQTIAVTIDADTNDGTNVNPIIIQGYSATVGDGVHFVIDADSTSNNCINMRVTYATIMHMDCENNLQHGLIGGEHGLQVIENSFGATTWNNIYTNTNGMSQRFLGNELTAGNHGMYLNTGYGGLVAWNYIHDVTDIGLVAGNDRTTYLENLIETGGEHGIYSEDSDGNNIISNTVYNFTLDNVEIDAGEDYWLFMNNILTDTDGENLDINGTVIVYGYNNLYDNGGTPKSGTIIIDLGGESTADPALDAAFMPGSNMDDIGYPQYFDKSSGGTSIPVHKDMGAISYEETAGGGSGTNANGAVGIGF